MGVNGDIGQSSFNADAVRKTRSAFVVGYDNDIPIVCGALRPISEEIWELKRMYAESGTGSFILRALEDRATDLGCATVWLSTRIANHRSVSFYKNTTTNRLRNTRNMLAAATLSALKKS